MEGPGVVLLNNCVKTADERNQMKPKSQALLTALGCIVPVGGCAVFDNSNAPAAGIPVKRGRDQFCRSRESLGLAAAPA